MKHLNNKIILALVVVMVFPSFLMATTNKTTIEGKIIWDEEQWFNPNAIVTTTFTGVRNVTCFVGPDAAYDLISSTLDKAETSFYLEVYTLSSLSLINKLIAAHTRDVEVLVLVSPDRVNSYEDDYTETAAYMLDQAGIDVSTANTSYAYTHAKFWIVDHQKTFVYSGNWAPSSIPEVNYARTNREMGYMFDNAEIATYYEDILLEDILNGNPTSGVNNGSLPPAETSGTYTHPFNTTYTVNADMEVTPVFSPDNSYDLIHALLVSATTSIDVELQYINFDCLFYDDLIDATQRGVTVRVLIPEPDSTSHNVTQPLISNGAQVRFFKATGYNHNKYINVDGQYVCVSSINWSNNSVTDNREAGAIVKHTGVATYFKSVFDWDWANSDVPVGFIVPVAIISPSYGEAIFGSYTFKVKFDINTYTSGTIKIGTSVLHTWTNPDGLETAIIDISSYDPGIYTITATGVPTVGDPIVAENDFNIIDADIDWLVLISEVRYDAVAEPGGEFIELFNGFDQEFLIGGWILTDKEDSYTIPEGTIIPEIDMLILARDQTIFINEMADLGITGVTPDLIYSDLQLANGGDEVILKDSTGEIKDACIWGTGSLSGHTPWTGTMDATVSLHRDPANHDTNDCSKDFVADTPDPGTVIITVAPSGFISGYILGTTVIAISAVLVIMRFRYKARK
ncbi:MAG TPA: phospholipase D-like domain-containing protein [Candidatus Bathyarchaeia archaeon]|nr:phospholipase D-like domain-containing protein [Candidatus Bathyarchaeia archaeon]